MIISLNIQDLPLDRADDLYKHLLAFFVPDEPTGLAFGSQDDPYSTEDWMLIWKVNVAQRTPIVCFKEGSDDIVGANMVYINAKSDNTREEMMKLVSKYELCLFVF